MLATGVVTSASTTGVAVRAVRALAITNPMPQMKSAALMTNNH
jgi:hypothetical protein